MCLWIKTDRGWRPWHASNIPCPNSNALEGVYKAEPLAAVQWNLDVRIDRWADAMQTQEGRQSKFSGNSFNEPLFGPLGERL